MATGTIRSEPAAVNVKGASMTKNPGIHVTPRLDGRWNVIKEGAERASRVLDTQSEAARLGRESARSGNSEFFLHGRNGQIRERDSYGRDPFPPKG